MNLPFYLDRVCLNVLAGNIENAIDVYQASEGHVVVGILSANYASTELAIKDMQQYQKEVNGCISVGLGGGNPKQGYMVADIAKAIQPMHINQVLPLIGYTHAYAPNSWVNALVSPSDDISKVIVSTGPESSSYEKIEAPLETAIIMIKEMGGSSIKYFPMQGIKHIEQYTQIARLCAKHDLALEPTGGIDLENFEMILKIALDAGVKHVIPHVYSSIMDENKCTKPEDVKTLLSIIKKLVD